MKEGDPQEKRDKKHEAAQDRRTLGDIAQERHAVRAGVIRMELQRLINSGKHTGRLNLGSAYWIPAGSGVEYDEIPNFQYYLVDGVPMKKEVVGKKLFGLLPKHGLIPTTLDKIPFEKYGNMPLDELLNVVKYTLDPENLPKPNPGNFI